LGKDFKFMENNLASAVVGGEVVQEGMSAPDFSLESSKGLVSLAKYRGQRNVILFFMREFSCPICRGHVNELSKMYSTLAAQGTEVIVVGGGSLKEAQQLAATYKLPFAVASDPDRSVYHTYGLHKALGLMQRSGTIVIDKQGIVRYVQRSTLPTGAMDKKALLDSLSHL
jgi:peroxiredoxin